MLRALITFATGCALAAGLAPARLSGETGIAPLLTSGLAAVVGAKPGPGSGPTPLLAAATEAAASEGRWQTPAALVVVAVTLLALGWRLRANARRRRRGCGGAACAAVSPDVERLRARLSGKMDR
jgi:hypothetical protein